MVAQIEMMLICSPLNDMGLHVHCSRSRGAHLHRTITINPTPDWRVLVIPRLPLLLLPLLLEMAAEMRLLAQARRLRALPRGNQSPRHRRRVSLGGVAGLGDCDKHGF